MSQRTAGRALRHDALVDNGFAGFGATLVFVVAPAEVDPRHAECRTCVNQLTQQDPARRECRERGVVYREPPMQHTARSESEVRGQQVRPGVQRRQHAGERWVARVQQARQQLDPTRLTEIVPHPGGGVLAALELYYPG